LLLGEHFRQIDDGHGIYCRDNYRRWRAAAGGPVAGFGIAIMHVAGISAPEFPDLVTWSLNIVLTAVAFGIVFGALALLDASRRKDWRNTLAATILLTSAVVLMHFTVMGAIQFVPQPNRIPDQASLSTGSLSTLVAATAAIVLSLCVVAAWGNRQSKDKLRRQKFLLDTALENMSQGLCMCDADGRILLVNERYSNMWGVSVASIEGSSLLDLLRRKKASGVFDADPDEFFASVLARMREGKTTSKVLQASEGRALRVLEQPMKGGGWVATFEDITKWREAQAQIAHMARHDALTNLPNRTLFREQLEQALHRTTRDEQVAVLCIDLDHFKEVNDSLGHPVGDELLKAVAHRLTECVREGDTVCRLGGDEFVIVQVGGESQSPNAVALANRLIEVVGAPYDIQGHQLVIKTSIGISVAPNDGSDPDQLLKNADMALYLAKADGRGAYRFFETGMDARAQARRLLMIDLRAALLRDEFEVYYQPIYDLETNRIICFEALVRWNHPLRGMIAPADFIPLAESAGLIIPIGDWVLRKACLAAASWSQNVSVAVNLSPAQFKNHDLVASVITALSEAGLAPRLLELEITESVLLRDSETTLAALHKLRRLGVRISMDDFGTGYSSLSYLLSFPFDKIKIDRLFVRKLASKGDSIAIVRAVTGLGKSLGILILAEGVETQEQLALLREEGCKEVQGFLFSQPRPAEEVERMLSRGPLRIVA
jgi:diguanylate cyclase (GGDEF)-like protein/PAS domain S-box-containing protein